MSKNLRGNSCKIKLYSVINYILIVLLFNNNEEKTAKIYNTIKKFPFP